MEQEKGDLGQTGGPSAPDLFHKESQLLDDLRHLRAQQRALEDELLELQSRALGLSHRRNGSAAAAIVASSFGVLVIGLLTTLAAASARISDSLNWYNPTGPLAGKTTLGVIIWLLAWLGAHLWLGRREVNFNRVIQVSVALIVAGLLLTFPPIFDLFK